MSRRQQTNLVPQGANLPSPIMRRAARLHPNTARRHTSKEFRDLGPAQLAPNGNLPRRVNTVNLKYGLRDIHTNRGNLDHGRLLQMIGFNDLILAHRCRTGAVHHITVTSKPSP